jgi:galactose mutarotase-like enzyme
MQVHLENDQLSAVIASTGSELISLQLGGKELVWEAGLEWARHAPILFPIIGRVTDDVIRHNGRHFPINQHGFVRDTDFTLISSTPNAAHLRLDHSPTDDTKFPFPFSLETQWHLEADELTITFILTNTGQAPLPAALGWHPAFRMQRDQNWKLLFERDETGSTRRVNSRVQLTPEKYNSPLTRNSLSLSEDLFSKGAIIFESLLSRTVRLVSADGPMLSMGFPEFSHFAVWKKPGADFICLEPWSDLPQTDGERHDISMDSTKLLTPGARKKYSCRLSVHVG